LLTGFGIFKGHDSVPETKTVFHLFDSNHFAAPMTFLKVYFASTLGVAKNKLMIIFISWIEIGRKLKSEDSHGYYLRCKGLLS